MTGSLVAGISIDQFSIVVSQNNYFPRNGLANASFEVVDASVTPALLLVDPKACTPSGNYSVGSSVFKDASGVFSSRRRFAPPYGLKTQLSVDDVSGQGYLNMDVQGLQLPMFFLMGGQFKLCYSQDATFGEVGPAYVLPEVMQVWGVYDKRPQCQDDDSCMRAKKHRCYLLTGAYNNPQDSLYSTTSCVVDYTGSGMGYEGSQGGDYPRASWSSEFRATYSGNGALVSTTASTCGSEPATFLCHSGNASCSPYDYFQPTFTNDSMNSGLQFFLPTASNNLFNKTTPRFEPRTVAACYCAYKDCRSNQEFRQQIGLLLFYVSKVCYNGLLGELNCHSDFNGATPQSRFSLRVLCPPGGCAGATQSRVKIVAQIAVNDLPSWTTSFGSSITGCFAAVHGVSRSGKVVLPDDVNPNVTNVNGRVRQDYKIWNYRQNTSQGLNVSNPSQSGFLFNMGYSDYEKRNDATGETFDVCYCDDTCSLPGNWFKVGQLRFASFQLVSALTNVSATQADFSIVYANQPGMLGFQRLRVDRLVMGLQELSMVKLVADGFANISDDGCKDDLTIPFDPKYDRSLVFPGPMIDYYYRTAYNGYQGVTNMSIDPQKLIFNGGLATNRITILKAGFLAVCYCANQTNGACLNNQWVLAARMTIRGPQAGLQWRFSTNVVFRLEYAGWGLTSNDRIRIIPATSNCMDATSDKYGPNGAYTATSIMLGCPDPCAQVGAPTSSLNGGIQTLVYGDDTYQCDDQNSACRNNDVQTVTVLDAERTEIVFEHAHGLQDGDKITITDNLICHPDETADECNDAQLATIKGLFPFADAGLQAGGAPATYFSGQIVTVDPNDDTKVTIPVGWPTAPNHPRFQVQFLNNKRGKWTRHSKATTKLEIMGDRALENLKVCWAYSTTTAYPKYTTLVGTITLEDANAMQDCLITLTTTVKNQKSPWAPFILSFRTAGSETGKKYSQVLGQTMLTIKMTRSTSAIYATFGSGAALDSNAAEDAFSEARQYICGKLFREMWSSNVELGFPLPHGCYYRVYGVTQEINIVFDTKNGLKGGEDYQLVMTGVVMDEASLNQKYAEILTMDDHDLNPYTAIERGQVLLATSPMARQAGQTGVKLYRPDGVKVTSFTAPNMMELTGNNAIKVALKGDSTGGGIKKSSILRIFLWPLTQWDMETSCTVTCTSYDDITYPCGAVQDCRGQNLIPNFNVNVIKIVFPIDMATMTETVSHTLTFIGLVYPKSGFFPTRFGVELRRPDDTKPDYAETSGNMFYKQPNDGASVGKLVEFWGDGDEKPFRGDTGNVLYVSILLAATLYSNLQSNDAVLTIILPVGYECLYPATQVGDPQPWQAPDNLGVFGNVVPQGTGAPFESDAWTVSENTCRYALRQNGVIFAGSSMLIRVTVNNPVEPLKRTDTRNRWQLILVSKGYYTYQLSLPSIVFGADAEMGNYSSNKPVLGWITDAKIIPDAFAVCQTTINPPLTNLRIFFRTEQETGVNAQVRIEYPTGFFVPSPCTVMDIPLTPFNYYVTYPILTRTPTKRLPGILGCEHMRWPGQKAFSHVGALMSGSLLADTYYGFQLQVQNDFGYDRDGRNLWQIYTTDGRGNRVDGTPRVNGSMSTIGMLPTTSGTPYFMVSDPSFGLYQRELDTLVTPVRVNFSDMRPSRFVGPAMVQVSFQIPSAMNLVNTTLLITAPEGFGWLCDGSFYGEHMTAPSYAEANSLFWDISTWVADATYAFRCLIQVPAASPTHSVNELVIQMGHQGATLMERYAASAVPIPQVQAVVSAEVDYSQNTNLQDPPNQINFQFQTVTPLKEGGGVYITGPGGFELATMRRRRAGVCEPSSATAQRGAPYQVFSTACCGNSTCAQVCPQPIVLPQDVGCQIQGFAGDPVRMLLTVGPSGLQAGLYRFTLQAVNPAQPIVNVVNVTSPCGQQLCWGFSTLDNVTIGTLADAPTYTPAFPISQMLVEGGMSTTTDLQAALSGRDDRPTFENSLIFYFKLNRQKLEPETLQIRAPIGFVFHEDCLSSLEIRETEVYGSGQQLPAGFSTWPKDVLFLGCRGEGPNAFIMTDPGIGQGFRSGTRYPFRIKVFNPQYQPATADNKWVIAYGDEASRPFTGFALWTFTRVLTPPLPVTIGASLPDSSVQHLWNPVTFTFAPYNAISGVGMQIRVTAPTNFAIAQTAGVSRALVQPVSEVAGPGVGTLPSSPKYDSRASQIWGDSELRCAVDTSTPRMLTITVLSDTRQLEAGRDYQITIFVYNPMVTMPADQDNMWVLETYNSPTASPVLPLFRDRITIQGYAVVDTPTDWLLLNKEPGTGIRFYNGLQRVKKLYFEMQFPTKLVTTKPSTTGDYIVISTPAGYRWFDCLTFSWEPPTDYLLYLPNSPRTCVNGQGRLERSNVTFRIKELLDIPASRTIKFRLDAQNAVKTPHVMLNHWLVTHYDGGTNMVRSTTAEVSWDIVPQLANVAIELSGTTVAKSAGSQSRISVSFMPITDADQLTLQALLPLGFDFTGCSTLTSGHQVISTNRDTVVLRAAIFAGVQTIILIDNLRLGQIGGPTTFNLVTRLNNGEQMDESLSYTGGFVLPGHLLVIDQSITSEYMLNPSQYPGQRDVQMQANAIVSYTFTVTRSAAPGDRLSFSAPRYTLLPQDFILRRYPGGSIITTQVTGYQDGSMTVQLSGSSIITAAVPGVVTPNYQVSMRVLTPSVPNPSDTMWTIQVLSTGVLPLDTNDGTAQGFRLVDNIGLQLTRPPTNQAPPMAQVNVELTVDPKSTSPTALYLVAPPLFNFTQNCLVNGGDSGEIVSCTLQRPDSMGRATALLITRAGGLTAPTSLVVITVTTPAQDSIYPAFRKWFIDVRDAATGLQLGWGEDPTGISVRQMPGAAVVFSGIPHVAGQLTVQFYSSQKVNANGVIRVYYPRSVVIMCDGAFFFPVSLQGAITCRNDARQGIFDLVMARPLPPGLQAFAVTATPPDAIDDAGGNIFKVMIFNPQGQVVDAAMNVSGLPIQGGVTVGALPLIWSSSVPLSVGLISLGFELLDDMPPKDPPIISEVVVTVPLAFEQIVRRGSQIEVVGLPLPLRTAGPWLAVDRPRQVVLRMDEIKVKTLTPGRYRFAFPVLLPSQMPPYNVFHITLCGPNTDGTNSTCSGDPQDPRALTTFPLAGFALGEVSPGAVQYVGTAGSPLSRPSAGLDMLLALLALPWALGACPWG